MIALLQMPARSRMNPVLTEIRAHERSLSKHYRDGIERLDSAVRENWPSIIELAKKAGVSDEEMLRELGSSPSTIYRWISGDSAPREGTRRLMKRALLELLDDKLSTFEP